MTRKPPLVPIALFALALIPGQAQCQLVSEMWQITPKVGMEAGFQEAFKAHMEFRKAQGSPWVWQTWEIVVGEDVGDFLIVSWDHPWADFDAYENSDFAGIAGPHFGATVAPLVEDAANMISQSDTTMQTKAVMVGDPVLTGNSVATHPFIGAMPVPSGVPTVLPTSIVLGSQRVILE